MSQIVTVIVSAVIYASIYISEKDEDCDCSQNWRRDVVKWTTVLVFLLSFIPKGSGNIFGSLYALRAIIKAAWVFSIITYAAVMQEKGCECYDKNPIMTYIAYTLLGIYIVYVTLHSYTEHAV
jgi:hypothetical protein